MLEKQEDSLEKRVEIILYWKFYFTGNEDIKAIERQPDLEETIYELQFYIGFWVVLYN